MNHLGALSISARIVSRASDDASCPSGKRASAQDDPQRRCLAPSTVNYVAPPPGYAPPGVQTDYTPESKVGLYVGVGIGAVVVIGGLYMLFGRD